MNIPKHLRDLRYEPNKKRNYTRIRLMIILKIILIIPFLVTMHLLSEWVGFYEWVDRVFESPYIQLGFFLSIVTVSVIVYFCRWVKNQ